MSKYKYYFKKPRAEIVKDILKYLTISGAICIAASSPYFTTNLVKGLRRIKKYKNKKIYDTFYNLKRQGCIDVKKSNHQIYISLTKEGKRKAGLFQIDSLKINEPKKWDRKWRLVIFDISQLQRTKREAFRGKLKSLGFSPVQKSVWAHPFNCRDEIELLREFFSLSKKNIRLVIAQDIEDDEFLRRIFKLG